MKEYQERRNERFVRAKEEFQYLHDKLAHIKSLVSAYDASSPQASSTSDSRVAASTTTVAAH